MISSSWDTIASFWIDKWQKWTKKINRLSFNFLLIEYWSNFSRTSWTHLTMGKLRGKSFHWWKVMEKRWKNIGKVMEKWWKMMGSNGKVMRKYWIRVIEPLEKTSIACLISYLCVKLMEEWFPPASSIRSFEFRVGRYFCIVNTILTLRFRYFCIRPNCLSVIVYRIRYRNAFFLFLSLPRASCFELFIFSLFSIDFGLRIAFYV